MAGAEVTPHAGDRTFPANQGTVSGIIGIALVVVLIVLIGLDGWSLAGVRVQIGLAVFGVLTWALMLRPKILVRQRRLLLVNPFSTIDLPLHLVDYVEVRSVTKVHLGTRTYVGIAVGRKTRALLGPTPGGFGGAFSLRRGDAEAARGDRTADLVDDLVNRAATDARRDAEQLGTPDDAVRRSRFVPLYGVLGVLVLALAVTLLL